MVGEPMKQNPFRIGDRIAFYQSGERGVGTIMEVNKELVWIDTLPNWMWWKQCRRLKKKERLIAWVHENQVPSLYKPTELTEREFSKYVRFVESPEKDK